MAKRGAKLKLTAAISKELCDTIKAGNTVVTAYQLANVSEASYYRWFNKGEESIKKGIVNDFSQFVDDIIKAKAFAKAYLTQNIRKAGDSGDWKASAWILERCYKEEYAKQETIEHTGKDGGPIEIKSDPKEKLLSKLNSLADKIGEREPDEGTDSE